MSPHYVIVLMSFAGFDTDPLGTGTNLRHFGNPWYIQVNLHMPD